MSVKKTIFLPIAALVFAWGTSFAQNAPSVADSIDAQFTQLLQNSNNWEEYNRKYKVVRLNGIEKIRRATVQKLEELDRKNRELQKELDEQKAQFNAFKEQNQTKDKVEEKGASKTENEVTVLGFLNLAKETVQILVWSLIGILVLLVFIFSFNYKKSQRITVESRDKLKAHEKEFDEYRKKALDTQQKLGRQLQDMRNKMAKENSSENEDR